MLDHGRIALVVATAPDGGGSSGRPVEQVGTGYFLTGDLVLTARHIADRPDCTFGVRAEVGESLEKDKWSPATPLWIGAGDIDAMLLRTTRSFGSWEAPPLRGTADSGTWQSVGYPRATLDEKVENRKTLPLDGSFGISRGQGPVELALQTKQNIASNWEGHWKGISGAPVFSTEPGDGLIGIITDANRALSNGIIGLPATRLLNDIHFRSIIAPSFRSRLPSMPWCMVLTSESSKSDLVGLAADVMAGFRVKDPHFRGLHEEPIVIPVLKAVGSVENWAATVDALARADYLIADVTCFEPAVMLLLGIRSVLRRGVTVSVTGGELSAHSSTVPFNVQETRVLSLKDEDFYDDLYRAMAEGAANLARDSNYLDLPAYHAVRAPRPETWAENDAENLLVLCPFSMDYSEFYAKKLRRTIRAHTADMTPLRMLDLRSPRLVGQALYEQIRWSSRCIVDWTEWRPNVFFELGVRLACSEHNPLCIIQRSDAGESFDHAGPQSDALRQRDLLRQLLEPIEYDRAEPREALKSALGAWPSPPPPKNGRAPSHQVLPPAATFKVAQASFQWQQDAMLTPPHIEQRAAAELILGKDQEMRPERLILFAANDQFDTELRAAVREKWIAAWLYLQHLSTAAAAPEETRAELITVGRLVQHALRSSSDPRHVRLRKDIREFLGDETATVVEDLDQVLALKASAKSARDDEDWERAISNLQEAVNLLRDHMAEASRPVPSWLASELADTYGLIGGIQKRWGLLLDDGKERRRHLQESATAYDEGFSYERDLRPNDANSYNRVNRLVGRVLLDPRVLQKDGDGAREVADGLRKAEEILTEEISSARQKDPWAYCDLGTVRLLRKRPNALSAFHELDRLRPPAFVYDSVLATLQPLCEVASDQRPELAQAIVQLRRSARYSE